MAHRETDEPPVPRDAGEDPDPTFLHTRREAIWILLAWAVFLVWTIGASAWSGYGDPTDRVATLLGIPTWVVWGVLVPWTAALVFSIWFSLSYMREDDLGREGEAVEEDRDASEPSSDADERTRG